MAFISKRQTGLLALLVVVVVSLSIGQTASAATVGYPLPTSSIFRVETVPSPNTLTMYQSSLDASTKASGIGYTFPEAGWVTTFRIQIGSVTTSVPLRFKVIRPISANQFTVVGESKSFNPVTGLREFGGYCIAAQSGDQLALMSTGGALLDVLISRSGADHFAITPAGVGDPAIGTTLTFTQINSIAALIAANAEFETYASQCGPTPVVDTTRPTLTKMARSEKCVAYRRKSRSKKASAAKKSKRKKRKCAKKSNITYELNEAATVKLVVSVKRHGLKRKKKGETCKKASSKRRRTVRRSRKLRKKYKSCRVYVKLGSTDLQGTKGSNKYVFNGKFKKKTLRPDVYKLEFAAFDSAGNTSNNTAVRVRVRRIRK